MEFGDILTEKEKQLLVFAAEGKTIAATARAVQYSERTVWKMQSLILAKLGASNMTEAVAQAFLRGILTSDDVPLREAAAFGEGVRRLSPQEYRVLVLTSRAYAPKEIAERMGVTRERVYSYLYTIRQKLDVDTTENAVIIAKLNHVL